MSNRRLILLVIIVAATAFLLLWVWDFMLVDRCLDAGGRWDFENSRCEGSRISGAPELISAMRTARS
jgi:hypothetical protein